MTSLFTSEPPIAFARVAVERGIDRYPEGLTYGVPPALRDLSPGDRVLVPLGRGDRPAAGYVIEIAASTPLDPLSVKLIESRDAAAARLPGRLLDLARWMASYYCAPIGMTLAAMLPAAVKRGVGAVTRTLVDLGPAPPPEARLSPQQRALLEVLRGMDERQRPVEVTRLQEAAGVRSRGPMRALLERGWLVASHRTSIEAAWAEAAVDTRRPEALTPAQGAIVQAIGGALEAGFSAHLVHGVTGSGKTEVYLRLLEQVVARGKVAIVLVPEIALTPQTGGRLIGRFAGHRVAVLHSGLTAAQRHQQWALAADGTARIVLGARSAILAPVDDADLGLIVVDEEHDASYKQDQVPRYHGRDVAVRRAQLARCPIVLGSATPSLESWSNAHDGHYVLHRLTERVPGMRLPRVTVVDFAEQRRARRDRRVHLLGPALEAALGRALGDGAQALLLLNRRGFANYIACPDAHCGWVLTCDDCDVTMVYHKHRQLPTGGFVQCHHCLAEQRLPQRCPDCGNRVSTFGLGTQRVEEELAWKFPDLPAEAMQRVDSDTMRTARDFHRVLERFGAGEIRVLLGTQLIAKGLDYPGVRLVGVINADTALNLPDFRAAERTFQLVSQVAGRCGRSTDPAAGGQVIVQSFNPSAPAIALAAQHDYETFARGELDDRRRGGLPPASRMARIVLRDPDHVQCVTRAHAVADGLRRLADPASRVRGPAPCPIARIAGRHRQQVEILSPDAVTLQRLLARARSERVIHSGADMAVDVDPVALL